MNRYKCKICGYVYDPVSGEPRTDTPPGTAFEDLPDTWFCPKCGAGKIRFIKLS
ncbi:MAG TPA: rubredoxin [Methanobacteriaceae archaeon]|jgi:rubredoxin|nr:rubredoxin [Euryarchaeota archaeon]HNR26690.1 rubredoxin [Methanobacteriaceae archaeon]